MRYGFIAALAAFAVCLAPAVKADDAPKDVKGLFLMSDYPAVTLRPGETSTVSLRIQNYNMTPERLALSVSGVPSGWTATLLGGGQPVAAAMPATNSSVSLSLRLDVPKDAAMGTQTLTVAAAGGSTTLQLPIAVTLAKDLPAKLTVTPQLPELRGTVKSSFEYQLSIKNDSGKKLTVALSAQAPQNFDATFTEQYGSQELSAVPVDAGQTKDVKLKVTPPNIGTAPAEDIQLSGSAPSGWKVTFEPKTIERIAPSDNKEVQALITPTEKAIAGDYVTAIRASARGESASSTFRVTVTTSTMWGIAGVGIIGVALLVMVGAVARFGRR
jgi:uncharacterized membrane protein